jgi:quercetin dioxygenase-like cupin family protein
LRDPPFAPRRYDATGVEREEDRTSKAGDVVENPVTGERVVVRVGTEDSGGRMLVADAYVRPGGAVTGEHVHPAIEEYFTVVRGRVGFRLDGRETVARPGERLHVPAGTAHV